MGSVGGGGEHGGQIHTGARQPNAGGRCGGAGGHGKPVHPAPPGKFHRAGSVPRPPGGRSSLAGATAAPAPCHGRGPGEALPAAPGWQRPASRAGFQALPATNWGLVLEADRAGFGTAGQTDGRWDRQQGCSPTPANPVSLGAAARGRHARAPVSTGHRSRAPHPAPQPPPPRQAAAGSPSPRSPPTPADTPKSSRGKAHPAAHPEPGPGTVPRTSEGFHARPGNETVAGQPGAR